MFFPPPISPPNQYVTTLEHSFMYVPAISTSYHMLAFVLVFVHIHVYTTLFMYQISSYHNFS